MKFFGILSLFIVCYVTTAQAQPQPMIVSFAVQPVNQFNQELRQAQSQHLAWAKNPSSISSQYAGDKFTLVRTQTNPNSTLTYQISAPSRQHPQMLLLLSLKQTAKLWQVDSAQLAWRCGDDQHFGTDRCHIAEHHVDTAP